MNVEELIVRFVRPGTQGVPVRFYGPVAPDALLFEETIFSKFPFLLLGHPDFCSSRNSDTIFRTPRPAQSDRFTFVITHDMPSSA